MKKIKVEVSARHCHLSRKDLDQLFGLGYELTIYKKISQPGQFASNEMVTIKTPGGHIENVRILGPVREKTQIEISLTDARKLKINPPVRLSGDLSKSESCILIGPKGSVHLQEGVIVAKNHIHCDPKTAEKLNLKNKQQVSIKIESARPIIFSGVEVRIDKNFVYAFHIDTDEGNASLSTDIKNTIIQI
ncbi:MAG: phosphate propanoyltransferase [Minisyncoccia bacterium]